MSTNLVRQSTAELDATIARLRYTLARGEWLTGERLTGSEQQLLRWHLELAVEERRARRRDDARA